MSCSLRVLFPPINLSLFTIPVQRYVQAFLKNFVATAIISFIERMSVILSTARVILSGVEGSAKACVILNYSDVSARTIFKSQSQSFSFDRMNSKKYFHHKTKIT